MMTTILLPIGIPMNRRLFLHQSTAALALAGCRRPAAMPHGALAPALPFYDAVAAIPPIRADLDRIFRVTVCLRPFRAAGPRLDLERVGDKLVVHNYGHGGSGWSLSWGSAEVVVHKALQADPTLRQIAVIGCGALGLTAALTAQRSGLRVTLYARERPPFVRSARATGSWTPDSRVALTSAAPAAFAAEWESMARASFAMYQSFLGMPGDPIEWTDRYSLSEGSTGTAPRTPPPGAHEFVRYHDALSDLTPRWQELPPGSHPFGGLTVRRTSTLTFNVADYSRQLLNDFLIAGGALETREFHTPSDLASLPERMLLNCTGYGARQLWSDESLTPVRGQIAWLIPQEGVHYALQYGTLNVVGRRDGIVVQPSPQGEETGWNDPDETPNRAEAELGVRQLQDLYSRIRPS
jgi:glycine/D-amino acid oxidase-like deaminating enzyme